MAERTWCMSMSCCWRGSLWSLSQGLMCQVSSLQSQCFISCVINVYPGRVTLKLGKLLTLWNQLCHPQMVLAWINSYHDSCHILLFLILPLLCRCHLTFCWKHITFPPFLLFLCLFLAARSIHFKFSQRAAVTYYIIAYCHDQTLPLLSTSNLFKLRFFFLLMLKSLFLVLPHFPEQQDVLGPSCTFLQSAISPESSVLSRERGLEAKICTLVVLMSHWTKLGHICIFMQMHTDIYKYLSHHLNIKGCEFNPIISFPT